MDNGCDSRSGPPFFRGVMLCDVYGTTQFEKELLSNSEILNLVMDETFAHNLYASLCNNIWTKGEEEFSASWRYSAGVVAHLRNTSSNQESECYLDFYCSGHEGEVFPDVLEVLSALGWTQKCFSRE